MKEKLSGKVTDVRISTRIKSHPVSLTADGEISIEMEKVLQAMPDNQQIKADKVLELNIEEVMEEKGIQMNHRSQSVTEDLLRWADLVLTMTAQHKHSLMIEFPHYQEKYFTLKEYVSPADQRIL